MIVRELMRKPAVKVSSTAPVQVAARHMRDRDVGAVIVEEDGKPYGIVTDRDIAIRAVAEGLNPETAPIASICSKDVATVSPEADVESAIALMRERALRRIMVVDADRVPLGVISLGDLTLARGASSILGEISAAPANR
jgi:signal-transduction protein with cAMP-binding, CBS, and nucleotidyltransferase domain